MKKISVALAAFHGEKYIAEQLRSLFEQTRLPDEILIGDDSPDDATSRIAETFAAKHPGLIRIFKNSPPKGINGNFASLIEQASGDMIMICDQDDVWLPGKIERIEKELDGHPESDFVFCNSRVTDEDLERTPFTISDLFSFSSDGVKRLNSGNTVDMRLRPMVAGHNIAIRKNFRHIMLPIPSDVKFYDMWMCITASVSAHPRYIDEELTLYRRHDSNSTVQETSRSVFKRLIRLLKHNETSEIYLSYTHLSEAFKRLESLKETHPLDLAALKDLGEIASFYKKRLAVSRRSFIPRLSGVVFLKGYFRYANGFKSIARDLIFRTVL